MQHGLPNYFVTAPFDLTVLPAEVLAFFVALDALLDPTDSAPPMRGTQDSVYDAGNPAVHP